MERELNNPDVTAFFGNTAKEKKVIFIAGCARSGTSLLHRCMATIESPDFLWSENSLLELYERGVSDGTNIVLKRRASCHKTLHLAPNCVNILYIVRNPKSVLTSRVRHREGYYVSAERWAAEAEAYWRLKERHPANKLVIVRYEDLVANPDHIQTHIGDKLDVVFDFPFSEYWKRNYLDKKVDKFTQKLRVWEKIDTERTTKSRSSDEGKRRIEELDALIAPQVREFCKEFNYSA